MKWPSKPADGGNNGSKKAGNNLPINRARFFPLRQRKRRKLTLRSEFGDVELIVDYGQHPPSGQWLCPVQVLWGLRPHQKITPGYAQKLCFTVTATGSYAEAAAVARQWGEPVDDSTLQTLVRRVGAQAEAQMQERLPTPTPERQPQRAASPLAELLVDGWQVRQRGEGWGKKKTQQPRVEWHELKTGVFYQHEQSAQTAGGRGLLADKVVVSWQGEPGELVCR